MSDPVLQDWLEEWDRRISLSLRDEVVCIDGLVPIYNCYRAAAPASVLQTNAMPEPYVGDPFSPDLAAAFLCLNPGGAGTEQFLHPVGETAARVRGTCYSAVARSWQLAAGTIRWWRKKADWLGRFLGDGRVGTESHTVRSGSRQRLWRRKWRWADSTVPFSFGRRILIVRAFSP